MAHRTLEELKEILKQPNEDFNRLVEEAERRSNGDVSRRFQILTELVVHGFRTHLKAEEDEKRSEESPRSVFVAPINPSSIKKPPSPTERSRSTVNPKEEEEEEEKNRRPRVSNEDAKRLKEWGSRLGLPEDVREKMEELGGVEPVLVITKHLSYSDMAKNYSRFSLPSNQLEPGVSGDGRFLSEAEWERVTATCHEEIKARLVGPMCSDPTEVSLKGWKIGKGISLVVTGTGWNLFMDKHAGVLNEGDKVQLWASRCNQERDLLLALLVVH